MFQPRPKQQEVLSYVGGKMGVAAVPGSGKTQTLSYLAAQLVVSGRLADDQEVLVVTLVNSAVDNFRARVASFVRERGLLAGVGYRVRTLHGLAHDIVAERPGLVGLAEDFQIVDEREAGQILDDAAQAWLRANPSAVDDYLDPSLDERKRDTVRRQDNSWPQVAARIAYDFMRVAKDQDHTPEALRHNLDAIDEPLPLPEMGLAIYADYQRALAYRGAVDFDDLIRLALRALELDPEYLARLRLRWPYILEDEAQDSSRLQEKILRKLAEPRNNRVRVGDPNQAIFETFTTASPQFLRNFLAEPGVAPRELPNSGRSTASIMALANRLVSWAQADHPVPELRSALTAPPFIEATPPGDPQPNPPDDPGAIRFIPTAYAPADEVSAVADSLERWLPAHQDQTAAVLVPRNDRGFAVADELKRRGMDYIELLRSTGSTRAAAGALANIVKYAAAPSSEQQLAKAFLVWRRGDRSDPAAQACAERVAKALRKCAHVEDFVWPRIDRGPGQLAGIELPEEDEEGAAQVMAFRELARRWQGTAALPIDQAVLAIAEDLFDSPADLALAHKLAGVLRTAANMHPDWRLPELTNELAAVAKNERKFLGFGADDIGFDPERHRGTPVIATIHKAKGLEWDRVYLMSLNNYDFPSALAHDSYMPERWFIRDGLNMEAEALAQLKAVFSEEITQAFPEEGAATHQARFDYSAERLRLLYVGITRAKRDLIMTWNTGRRGDQQPSAALTALRTWWEEQNREPAGD